MKRAVGLAIVFGIVVFAVLLQGLGGWLNMTGQDGTVFRITSQHAWNDGVFLLLIAILIAVVYL